MQSSIDGKGLCYAIAERAVVRLRTTERKPWSMFEPYVLHADESQGAMVTGFALINSHELVGHREWMSIAVETIEAVERTTYRFQPQPRFVSTTSAFGRIRCAVDRP